MLQYPASPVVPSLTLWASPRPPERLGSPALHQGYPPSLLLCNVMVFSPVPPSPGSSPCVPQGAECSGVMGRAVAQLCQGKDLLEINRSICSAPRSTCCRQWRNKSVFTPELLIYGGSACGSLIRANLKKKKKAEILENAQHLSPDGGRQVPDTSQEMLTNEEPGKQDFFLFF